MTAPFHTSLFLLLKHIILECVHFAGVRRRFCQVPTLQDLFKSVKAEVILEFLESALNTLKESFVIL